MSSRSSAVAILVELKFLANHNKEKLDKITEAMKQFKDRRMYELYQAIYLHLKGISMTAIADILNWDRMTVSSYIHTHNDGGLTALQWDHLSGAPSRLTKGMRDPLSSTMWSISPLPRSV
ncbi:hypothetical protein BK120_08845 [Paenibacillus sp. FSL A5-0031]|uniref:helix-turn-helix domain-containing protein n=1 Tax=Paenibacillus sp. FSL A5-0031 TaxID=1920420 RepID=UPI00096F2E49|nr:helix-turn-helix domain-containing protein [Paenibacillus sp. FSL A5-0031]OME86086.1 hypothetical protein BK120_08845 [Paenibacillus sp. FSL A5-0031]